ncbi:MAG TPA: ABC transporter substrate-binding protein [Candidatus Acidoferrum sp.]|nr:ABC transporter substrate-binding protein [Candidatus Acidoferrum sp.]
MKFSTSRLILIALLALLTAPVPSNGQQPAKVYRIGYFSGGTPPTSANTTPQGCPIKGGPNWQAFVEGLREYGYLPGQNLVIECRWTEGRAERAPALATELVSLTPDLIVEGGYSPNIRAAKQATSTIPILTVTATDPVGRGFVASLAHPGGNLTGLTDSVGVATERKQLQLLKEAVPKAARVAALRYSGAAPIPGWQADFEAAARALGLTLQRYEVREPDELEGAFTAMTNAQADALLVVTQAFLYAHRHRILDLAAKNRLPVMYSHRDFVEAGGLMSYWASDPAIWRRAGFYVDKILKGAKPGDLPIEQPTKFDLLINLKTAKALGLTIPPSLLNRADEVIQ